MNEQMREKFEAWYIADAALQGQTGITLDDMRRLREGDLYGEHRVMLNGKWEGWQAAALSQPAAESFIGQAEQADFEDDTWTFKMQHPYIVGAGFYRISYIGLTAPKATP